MNSDFEIIDCQNCGSMSNITLLEKIPLPKSLNMTQQSVMKELKTQQEEIDRAEIMENNVFFQKEITPKPLSKNKHLTPL